MDFFLARVVAARVASPALRREGKSPRRRAALKSDDRDRRGLSGLYGYGRYLHLGTQFCILVVGGVLGGWWLDERWDLMPLFTVLGACFGMTAGVYALYRTVFDRKRE